MASTWERVTLSAMCGNCGKLLSQDEPVLIKTLPGLKRPLRRCEACEGPAPPDLPRPIVLHDRTSRMTSAKPLAIRALSQWKPRNIP